MSAWSDGYKDPRWQKKRLEIMQRDNFTCLGCGSTTNQLQVHHGYYPKGAEFWEAPNGSLWTLCDGCHESATKIMHKMKAFLGFMHPHEVRSALQALTAASEERPKHKQETCGALQGQWGGDRPCDPRIEAAYKHLVGAVLVDPGLVLRMQPWVDGCPLDSLTAVMRAIVAAFEDEEASGNLASVSAYYTLGDHPVRGLVFDLYEIARDSEYPAHQLLEESVGFLENYQLEQHKQVLRELIGQLTCAADEGDADAKETLCGVQAELAELHKSGGQVVA